MTPDDGATLPRPEPYDLAASLRFLQMGQRDPTLRRARGEVWRATWTPDGPATVRLVDTGRELAVRAWGPGARAAVAAAPALLGLHDTPEAFDPDHPTLARLWRAHPGLHLPDSGSAVEALIPTICQQLVTWLEACRIWHALVRDLSEPAPGPAALWLPPSARALAGARGWVLERAGLGRRRGSTVKAVGALAARLQEALVDGRARQVWSRVPGIGPWTVEHALGMRLGDADAVIVGDYHLPDTVAWALAREPRADDDRMKTLLAPYTGHRFRVVHLLWMAGVTAPRRGPKRARRR